MLLLTGLVSLLLPLTFFLQTVPALTGDELDNFPGSLTVCVQHEKCHETEDASSLSEEVYFPSEDEEELLVDEGCQLYMAESSIPNSGLGIYTAVPLEKGQIINQADIALSMNDHFSNMKIAHVFSDEELAEWNQVVAGKDDLDESCLLWAKGGDCETDADYMLHVCSKSCAVRNAGLDLDKIMATQDDKHVQCKDLALKGMCHSDPDLMIPNCPGSCYIVKYELDKIFINAPFLPNNYFWSSEMTGSEQEADQVSSVVPGIGALVNSHVGLVNVELRLPSVGSAGYHRSKDPGVGAFSDRFNVRALVNDNIPAGMELFLNYGSAYSLGREMEMGGMPTIIDYEESEAILKKFWKKMDKNENTTSAVKTYEKLLDSITEAMVKMAMPKTYEEAQSVRHTKAAMLTVPNAIKSREWLNENGMCLDNIYSSQSKLPQAGRGAFANRNIKTGQIIAPMPLLHMNKKSLRTFKKERELGGQLMLNYVYGHKKSSLVLLPYSPIVNFVNNHSDKSKVNAKIQWSKQKHHKKSWEDQPIEYILQQLKVGLVLELVAISDIDKDEEIYIDYGAGWDKAWTEHIENWKPPPRSEEYMSVEELNASKEVKTENERVQDPLGYNVDTICKIDTGALVRDITSHTSELNWADYNVDVDREGTDDSTIDCFVIKRYLYQKQGETTSILYQTYIVGSDHQGEKKIFLNGVPRDAIFFRNKRYTSDQHIEDAFRHVIEIPDEIFPPKWMDLKH